ncbi:hypothetical protein E5161_11190 [Cohnella pontilimi]|uniref:Membrane protein YczE n=1 Tax=Cohnella pontilimi TaxID=2564100 RepID=A0A4U0FAE0_9BACL|nr:DUF6198 family protein [Cohnella pontilimi]TJY41763.1 hypothetical protein E5161_11190 [Cohnella pontilimi]
MVTSKKVKRFVIYLLGLFFLSLGISFSIQAGLGVSPVSSLAYALTLTTGISVGMTTVAANIFYFLIQVILKKRFEFKQFVIQIVIAFLFGLFIDVTLLVVKVLPAPDTIVARIAYLMISLFVVSVGLLGYFTSKLPFMPYDALTYAISERFHLKFSKAKIASDVINVCISGALCLIFVQSLGSIGIGTVVAACFIGKILGEMIKYFQQPLIKWVILSEQVA